MLWNLGEHIISIRRVIKLEKPESLDNIKIQGSSHKAKRGFALNEHCYRGHLVKGRKGRKDPACSFYSILK